MTKIGDALWFLDSRDRRRGWKAEIITGETKQSWLLGDQNWRPTKVNKKTMLENLGQWGYQRWHTEGERNQLEWVGDNRANIVSAISALADVEKLKQIAALVGVEVKS